MLMGNDKLRSAGNGLIDEWFFFRLHYFLICPIYIVVKDSKKMETSCYNSPNYLIVKKIDWKKNNEL